MDALYPENQPITPGQKEVAFRLAMYAKFLSHGIHMIDDREFDWSEHGYLDADDIPIHEVPYHNLRYIILHVAHMASFIAGDTPTTVRGYKNQQRNTAVMMATLSNAWREVERARSSAAADEYHDCPLYKLRFETLFRTLSAWLFRMQNAVSRLDDVVMLDEIPTDLLL